MAEGGAVVDDERFVRRLVAARTVAIPGVLAVTLGGSRAAVGPPVARSRTCPRMLARDR
jgi:hypothetical protein